MAEFWNTRVSHYGLLILVSLLLTVPNVGRHSLWDVDEGVNAEAAREMLEKGDYIVPIFNFELRTAKPVFLYWLQMTSYSFFGVSEFSARLPSLLISILTVLVTYELARSMSRPSTGLLSGLILSSAILFCLLSHAATPDATLLFFTTATFAIIWWGLQGKRNRWMIFAGFTAGLGVLTKGPVALALPGLVLTLYTIWTKQYYRLWNHGLIGGWAAFLCTALPWYIIVTTETRGAWAKAFFGKENLERFTSPMENHQGPPFYHLLVLIVLFAPWSVYLGIALWTSFRDSRAFPEKITTNQNAQRFLLCWFLSYLVFFSVAATKLPNYMLPVYPALAIMVGLFLDSWRLSEKSLPTWVNWGGALGFFIVGTVTSVGLLLAGGAVTLPGVKMRLFPGLEQWAWIGIVPMFAGISAVICHHPERRWLSIRLTTAFSILFVGLIAAFPVMTFDQFKAPKALIQDAEACRPNEEIRLAGLYYFQPSLVFYGQREIKKLDDLQASIDFLSMPYPVYLFVPEPMWKDLKSEVKVPYREVARHFDFLKNCDIIVLGNR